MQRQQQPHTQRHVAPPTTHRAATRSTAGRGRHAALFAPLCSLLGPAACHGLSVYADRRGEKRVCILENNVSFVTAPDAAHVVVFWILVSEVALVFLSSLPAAENNQKKMKRSGSWRRQAGGAGHGAKGRGAQADDVAFATARVPSAIACFASSAGSVSRTAV